MHSSRSRRTIRSSPHPSASRGSTSLRRKPMRRRRRSPIANNGMDVFADMKVAALMHKAIRWDARVMPAQAVLDLATIHAARALHVDREIGSIEVGKRADLAVVSFKGAHTTPFYPESVIRHLVYSGRGSDVQATIVDGKVLMAGGVVRTVDESDVIARAQETARELFEA